MPTNGDAFVFADADDTYYVVPRAVIEQHRVPESAKDLIDEELGVDTVGFASLGHGFSLVGPLDLDSPTLVEAAGDAGWLPGAATDDPTSAPAT